MSRSALIYTAIAAIAIAGVAAFALQNPAAKLPAGPKADYSALEGLRDGTMKKLAFHAEPKAAGSAAFFADDGSEVRLADHAGRYVLVNFWATWCAPCRAEMAGLSELQAELGGDKFEVLTIASGRNPVPAMKKFFEEIGVSNLPLARDPNQALAREMGILGLPTTLLLSPEGYEIARMTGDAEWNSESAKAIVGALIAPD